jgi:D-glycero-D-manno-heptose 1,7-bisphosphate phosphatase
LSAIIVAMSDKRASNFANTKYVFLDRDGVLNRCLVGSYVTSWEQFEILPGVEQAIAQLNRSGRKVIVVTNQRGIALGVHSEADMLAMHDRLRDHLAAHGAHLDAIYYCPHDNGQCHCRKPQTGMFEQAFQDFHDATASNSVMVGDSLADIEAASRLGMRSIFISDPAVRPRSDAARATALATACAASLFDSVRLYLDRCSPDT